jgi:sarcosine oxidase subunit alpha
VRDLPCDLLAVSGGWSPVVHLYSHAGGKLRWDRTVAGFVPRDPVLSQGEIRVVGAARGTYDLAGCLAQGYAAGAAAATDAGFRVAAPPVPRVAGDPVPNKPNVLWMVAGTSGEPTDWRTHFVDMQRDSTVADIARAIGAGMSSVEHIKRYTTISTGQDQGKTGAVNAIGVIATMLGHDSPDAVGTTTFRPPYAPVPFALLAGRDVDALADPVRTTTIHTWHTAMRAEFENVGQWKRPWFYPVDGETMDDAVRRECRAARDGVAMMDASTLGKIEIVGADAPEFLNRIYTNGFAKLAVGKARYGVMCKADGMVFDDGVTMRLAEDRYLMSTTSGNAAAVLDWLEEWLQTEWPDLSVHCTSVTEQWAAVAVVGPDSRAVLADVAPGLALDAESFPFMSFVDTVLGNGIPARIARISFSGELAFEVNVPSWYGYAAWEAIHDAGAKYAITPYGTETMHVLRAEKGFPIVGQDTDGTVTPLDLGMEWVVSKRKDFIGKRSLTRKDTARGDRKHLVGLLPAAPVPEGSALLATPDANRSTGHVTSSYHSVALGRPFALAMLEQGRDHIGATEHLPVDGELVPATVTEPIFYDPQGERRDGR